MSRLRLMYSTQIVAEDVEFVTYSALLSIAGQQLTTGPFTVSCPSLSCSIAAVPIFSAPALHHPTPGTYTFKVNGINDTYNFRYAAVPEPATLMLLGTGLLGIWWQKSYKLH